MGPGAARPFPPQHRNNGPYSLMQQQQQQHQGMMGTHTGMVNQAAMANTGKAEENTDTTFLFNHKKQKVYL